MVDKPQSGELFGVPYNFQRPSLRRLVSSYWRPGDGMLVEKPFGVGYSLNLANWRSWLVIATAGALLWQERSARTAGEDTESAEDEPVEVVVD